MAKERKPAGQPDNNEHHTQREETGEFQQTEETNNYGIEQPDQDQQDQQDQEELEFDEELDEHSQEEIDEENP